MRCAIRALSLCVSCDIDVPVTNRTKPDADDAAVKDVDLVLGLDEADDEGALRQKVAQALKLPESAVPHARIVRRAIDARRGSVRFRVLVSMSPPPDPATLG